MVSVGISRMGKTRGWSSSILERKLSSHYCNIVLDKGLLPDIKAIFVITGGHCSRIERQCTPPWQRWTIWRKSTSTSLNLTCGLQISLILIPWIMLFEVLFMQQRVYHQRQLKTAEELKRAIVTKWQKKSHSVSLITVSMNGVNVLKLLSRMAADTSSITTWLKQPHIILNF